jgi:hypothetical protein
MCAMQPHSHACSAVLSATINTNLYRAKSKVGTGLHCYGDLAVGYCMHRFEDMVMALGQEPATTEEMDALQKYLQKVQQVNAAAQLLLLTGSYLCVPGRQAPCKMSMTTTTGGTHLCGNQAPFAVHA